uniref:NADH dehydrogenase subunit 4L n=1 Tax=Centrorhynchus clitorideus TaxID=2731796 RepID=A0A6M3YWS6_9BILA|nr:NADH dehydrogenase subunit 4L [Centrorhynchus clitorideus]
MVAVVVLVMAGLMLIKSGSLVSVVVCLESMVLVFLVSVVGGWFMCWNCEVVLLGGVIVSVVVVSVVLSVYVVSVRSFGVGSILVSSMGDW